VQMAPHKMPDRSGIRNVKEIGSCDENREHLLLRELTRRINNELASTIGFVMLTAAKSGNDEVKLAMAGVIQHINDFARIYRALQVPATDDWIDAAKYLRELCHSISGAKLQHRDIELAFLESPLQLHASRCWRLGMIVSELVANASRHAFGEDGGKIEVELLNRGASVECSVTDNGSGLDVIRPGQGFRITQSLAHGLNGKIDYRFGGCGTAAMLSFPLVEIEPDHAEGNCLRLSKTGQR
jgi:two-component sensor histidine kinase